VTTPPPSQTDSWFEVTVADPKSDLGTNPKVVVGVVEINNALHCNLCDPETGEISDPVRIDALKVAPNSLGLVQLVGKLHKFGAEMVGEQLKNAR
jgi:hypothetical protein